MTWLEIVKDEAKKVGLEIDDQFADHVLWEFTGFPHFWDAPRLGVTPEECCRTQLSEHFSGLTGSTQ